MEYGYQFKLFMDNTLVGEGYSIGSGAMAAFEAGVSNGSIAISPTDRMVSVVAVSDAGLAFEFKVQRIY